MQQQPFAFNALREPYRDPVQLPAGCVHDVSKSSFLQKKKNK
jgi:hypothetical protein